MASSSSLADALISVLQAQSASVFDTGNLTKNNFGLLDTTTSGSVFVVLPGGFSEEQFGFGNPSSQIATYTLRIRCFVRDAGDPVTTLNRVWRAELDLRAALLGDDTLSGSAELAVLKRGGGWNGTDFVEAGGAAWLPQDFDVEITSL